jgi:Zn-dependent protease
MLNETASSRDDRPVAPSSALLAASEDSQHNRLREMVGKVLGIERETFVEDSDAPSPNRLTMMTPGSHLVATFEGQLQLDSEAAYEQLDRALEPSDYLPLFRLGSDGKHVVHVLAGRAKPKPRPWWPNLLLAVITFWSVAQLGADYAIAVMLILGAHELGHYFAARRHNLEVTLPYFIPFPFSPLGTLGAAIQLREPMRNRKVLLDVGAAGPLAGFIFSIPILLIGLATSQVQPITPGGALEGNSILYALAKIMTFGRFLPDGQYDVYVNGLAWAGWVGLLVTGLNLIPVGQLDGGHILYSMIGERARNLYYPVLLAMVTLALFFSDMWFIWVLLLLFLGRIYATPLDMITPLDKPRRAIAILGIVLFLLVFVPIPLTLNTGVTPGENVQPGPITTVFMP